MSDNTYTEISTSSYGSRIGKSFSGVIIGLVMFVASFPLICWNEGRSVERIITLDEGRNLVVDVSANQIDPQNEGALIHVMGRAINTKPVSDKSFGVSEDALKLKRIAEMYQWEETKKTTKTKNMGGSETTQTTYSYNKVWKDRLIKSSSFKKREEYQNPQSMAVRSVAISSPQIMIGQFELNGEFKDKINGYEDYSLSIDNFNAMGDELKANLKLDGDQYYMGDNSDAPAIGDIRVRYQIVKSKDMSVVGAQRGGVIVSYAMKHGAIALLQSGNISSNAMFDKAELDNSLLTWGIRFGALFLMFLGLTIIFKPLSVIGDFIPVVGNVLSAGIGLVAGVVTLVLGFVTMAIAWLFCRPIIGASLLLCALMFVVGGSKKIKKRIATPPPIPEQYVV